MIGEGHLDALTGVRPEDEWPGPEPSVTGRILGGVCAGLARRFGIAPTMMRILFVVTLIVIPGSQIIVYPILWILMISART